MVVCARDFDNGSHFGEQRCNIIDVTGSSEFEYFMRMNCRRSINVGHNYWEPENCAFTAVSIVVKNEDRFYVFSNWCYLLNKQLQPWKCEQSSNKQSRTETLQKLLNLAKRDLNWKMTREKKNKQFLLYILKMI